MAVEKGSVLAMMSASITARKGAASAGLTPIAGEAQRGPRIPEVPEVFLTQEAIHDIAKDLRRQASILLDAANGLDRLTGQSSVKVAVADPRVAQKESEKAADEAAAEREAIQFTERFEQLQAEAQAKTFTAPSGAAVALAEDMGEDEGETVHGWVCPDHAKAIDKTSPKGRVYRGCPDCRNFELPQ